MTPNDDDSPGIPFPPPFIYVAALGIGFLIHRYWPVAIAPPGGHRVVSAIGWVLVLGWAAISLPAAVAFRRARTSIIPNRPATTIVDTGPYRRTRNPMYIGLTLLSLGVACVFNALWPLVLVPLAVLVTDRYVIAREERYLDRAFGETYRDYQRRVGRWL